LGAITIPRLEPLSVAASLPVRASASAVARSSSAHRRERVTARAMVLAGSPQKRSRRAFSAESNATWVSSFACPPPDKVSACRAIQPRTCRYAASRRPSSSGPAGPPCPRLAQRAGLASAVCNAARHAGGDAQVSERANDGLPAPATIGWRRPRGWTPLTRAAMRTANSERTAAGSSVSSHSPRVTFESGRISSPLALPSPRSVAGE